MVVISTYWLPDITDWWHQQEERHVQYANLANVAHDTFSIILHAGRVEASFSLGQDVIGWRKSQMTGKTLRKNVVVKQYAQADNRVVAGNDSALDMTDRENDFELNTEAEEIQLHRLAKVHDFVEMYQGSQNLYGAQKESHTQIKQMTAIEFISHTEEIVQAALSNFQHNGLAALKL